MFHPHRGQDQKTIITDHTVQVGSASVFCPSNIVVSALQRPGCRTEGQGPKIAMIRTLDNVPDLGPTQRSTSKIVVLIKERKPNLGFLGISAADRINSDFAQFAQRTTEFSNIRLNEIDPRALKAIESLPPWQIHKTPLIQLGQRLSATHVLQSAIGRSPIQPFTNPSRQIESRERRFCSDSLLNPIQNGLGKMMTANIHVPRITSSTPCVKCVL